MQSVERNFHALHPRFRHQRGDRGQWKAEWHFAEVALKQNSNLSSLSRSLLPSRRTSVLDSTIIF